MCLYVCVFVFLVVWCRVMSCAARGWVVGWLGGWVCWGVCVVDILQRARAERSMIASSLTVHGMCCPRSVLETGEIQWLLSVNL